MLLINAAIDDVTAALKSWNWIGVADKTPLAVTAFGDVFFEAEDGILFLDTVEGKLIYAADDKEELEKILNTEDGQEHYLFAGFVMQAIDEGKSLGENQCYCFKTHPVLGGELSYENIDMADLMVTLDVCGQIHEQVKDLPEGADVSEITID